LAGEFWRKIRLEATRIKWRPLRPSITMNVMKFGRAHSKGADVKRFLQAVGSVICLLFLAAPVAHARPPYKKALADFLGLDATSKLNDCRTCHVPSNNDEPPDGPKPHNAFGARLKAVKEELKKAGRKTDIVSRILAVADEDSDGDGVPNLLELVMGRSPGELEPKPTAAEAAAGRKKLTALLQANGGYPWTPYEKVKRPDVPAVKNSSWVRNPIDAFIAAEHEAHGLKPRPEASKPVLLRRVYLDMTGLPPTPEELHAFLDDPSPNAYEKVVDRLLASPRYGERWGRHWMDVWRYSDWAGWGAQVRDSQPHIWHWRDWIVESLNADKGYDRMILEMLAADELAPDDPNSLRATGYLARNYKLLSREKWMQDTVEHTFMAFQGVTIGCARCHDHMYDPVLQKEYYQLRAVFEPYQVRMDRIPGQPDVTKDGIPRVYDAAPPPTFLFIRGDDRTPDKTPLSPGVPEALGGTFGPVQPLALPQASFAPDKRPLVIGETIAASANAAAKAKQALDAARLATGPGAPNALALAELDAPLVDARHAALLAAIRAEELEDADKRDSEEWKKAAMEAQRFQRQAAVLEARRNLLAARQAEQAATAVTRAEAMKKTVGATAVLTKAEADAKLAESTAYVPRPTTAYPKTSTGRRLALARWIANRDNPLTARVAMNHIWLRHFDQAIVPSVFDFGRNGRPASHPALLDWLAAEFMDHGWSMKHMHRLIVTSGAYRMSSTSDDADSALDSDNKYLWRMPPRRVEAEVVRDCVFYVAGRLDLTPGGPDIDHTLGMTVPRRSLYFQHAAEKEMEFLKLFDSAAVTECYRRKESILPQQALALSNSELVTQHARITAHALAAKVGDDPAAFITAAFERVLSRPPTADEKAECGAFLAEQTRRHAETKAPPVPLDADGKAPASDPALRARENLMQVLFNHNDFVTVR
jgi:Protein of unknown function (DUF1553)/Protein of unknown function (DUF1549)